MAESVQTPHGRPSVITAAQPSYDEQFRSRRRRYVIMMGMRIPFLIAAAVLYQTPWLALTLIVISVPLPWCAVLIANDRPARKPATRAPGVLNTERALSGPTREIIDAAPAPDADPAGRVG
jgi:hypothetical protein